MGRIISVVLLLSVCLNALGYERYNRGDWAHWLDIDGDCMNTRHEVLQASSKIKPRLSPDRCYVSKGLWADPYSGLTIDRPSMLDIDHVIPLHWAHKHGGAAWTDEEKAAFANDPANLLPVLKSLNQEKSDSGPTGWMPPNHGYRCDYLAKWNALLQKYSKLKMYPSEQRVFTKMIQACK
jgi:hypothetical protein